MKSSLATHHARGYAGRMRRWTGRSWISIVVIAALGLILVLLAVLQYVWSGRISEAERARMQANLNAAVGQFRNEFTSALQRICMVFQFAPSDSPGRDWLRYAQRYGLLASPDAHLVAGVFVWDLGAESSSQLLRLDTAAGKFVPTTWPASFETVRSDRHIAFPPDAPPEFRRNLCLMFQQIPLLLIPLVDFSPPSGPPGQGPKLTGYILIELNSTVLRGEYLPELARRYFGSDQGFIYQIAIVNGSGKDRALYQSDPALPPEFFSSPDSRVGLLAGPPDSMRFAEAGPFASPSPRADSRRPPLDMRQDKFEPRPGRPRNAPAVMPVPDGNNWVLLARHTEGTLGQVVAGQRRRNLAVSFGVLLLLALSMGMIILSTQRAQRLAKLQMDFVAGISHELRTPLSVICSAADNLAEGFVAASREQVRQYGDLIRQEGRRLAGMVEQILLFAKSQDGRKQYNLRRVQAGEIADSTLAKLKSTIDRAGFIVERQIEYDLPPVLADAAVLSQCIENLINNALKYGGANRWMRVSVTSAPGCRDREVRITVEDRGMGIEPADLSHIFDPFYRGAAAMAAQIHGSGLGLSLAREGIVAMGGRISVESTPDRGSAFTIHLPACAQAEESEVVTTAAP